MPNGDDKILIRTSAIAKMLKFDKEHPGKETIGLLIGHKSGNDLIVDEIRIGEQIGNAVHTQLTDEEMIKAATDISQREDGRVIVGWIHTHPTFSAFLSGTDVATQSLYQKFFPDAIAVVVDGVAFYETQNINDLDLQVFRVRNNKAVSLPYSLTNSVEFALNSFISEDKVIEIVNQTGKEKKIKEKYFVPKLSVDRLKLMRVKMKSLKGKVDEKQEQALNAWIDLSEAIADGTVEHIPIDTIALNENLENAIVDLDYTLGEIEEQMYDRMGTRTFMLAMFGIAIQIALFFLLS